MKVEFESSSFLSLSITQGAVLWFGPELHPQNIENRFINIRIVTSLHIPTLNKDAEPSLTAQQVEMHQVLFSSLLSIPVTKQAVSGEFLPARKNQSLTIKISQLYPYKVLTGV